MNRLLFPLLFCWMASNAQEPVYTKYVDPMVGTGGHGHTFPGATVPFGMVQLSPDTRVDGSWDGCSGYHYSDSVIYGFSHTHLSGTGCSDFGDIMLMPMMGKNNWDKKAYSSKFSHKNEKARAGYYSVKLDDDNIDVELTATTRVGMHKYTFNKDGDASIVLDLLHRDKMLEGFINVIDDKTIEGSRRSEAWAKDQLVFYRISFSKPFDSKQVISGDNYDLNANFNFKVKKGESIIVKVALSPASKEGAKRNMEAELPGWDFESVVNEAKVKWQQELSKIEVYSPDEDKKKIFYTALYHTMIQPNVAMDVDGMYRGRDGKNHKAEGFTYYSVFSLWDTFRGAHPLYTIIDQKRTADFINTFLAQYEQGGRLPVWELASNETDCMIGYHSVSVIADAMVKGIKGFDYEKAFAASKHSAMLDHLGLKAYKEKGFISMEDEHESVSKTVEYSYDDWCIAQMAKLLRNDADYAYFMKRSQNWKNVFDPETGFMRPKKNGNWLSPFDPREVNNNFTEGNSWQYTFFVPHDLYGFKVMLGEGNDRYSGQKIDELFGAESKTTGRVQADITGLIGQYAHGNEPSHHMAYLYNYWGQPSKTQELVHNITSNFYKAAPDGLIGNEDCGQMSAWYVLSSVGFYSLCPGNVYYTIGAPSFQKVVFNLENNKKLILRAPEVSEKNFYIESIHINNHGLPEGEWTSPSLHIGYVQEPMIRDSCVIDFKMVASPTNWGFYDMLWHRMISYDINHRVPFSIVPVIKTAGNIFRDSLVVEIASEGTIFYSLDGSKFDPYSKPFVVKSSQTVFAKSIDLSGLISDSSAANVAAFTSAVATAHLYKMPHPDWTIKIRSKYNPQYTAGGDEGLIDGLRGEENWRKGEWQGYQYQDFDAVIDMGKVQTVSEFTAGFLQDSRSWILMPAKVEFYTSVDGINYSLACSIMQDVKWSDEKVQALQFSKTIGLKKARYVRVKAYNYGKLPEGHLGFGDSAFLFIDEIGIK